LKYVYVMIFRAMVLLDFSCHRKLDMGHHESDTGLRGPEPQ